MKLIRWMPIAATLWAVAPGCAGPVRLVPKGLTISDAPSIRGMLTNAPPGDAPEVANAPETFFAVEDEAGSARARSAQRQIVYNASFQLLVPNIEDALEKAVKKTEALGGYMESRNNAAITVRVPAAQFLKLVEDLKGLGLVTTQSISALDVTRQYMDLALRIETAEKARQRLLALLERAANVEETLKIEQEVRRLTEEVERMKGELKLLSDQIAYSTVAVKFLSSAPPPVPMARRTLSRFVWINLVGVEHVLESY